MGCAVVRYGRVMLLALLLVQAAAAAPDLPALTGRVVDKADMLSPAAEQRLTDMLAGLEQTNGDQVVVVTVPDLGDTSIVDYGVQLGRAWGIGQKAKDNGALLLIAKKQRAIRIEVGYGLEGQLTDARSSMIVRRIIRPAFRQNDYDGGVIAGTAAIVKTLGGNPGTGQGTSQGHTAPTPHHGPSMMHTFLWLGLMIGIAGVFGSGMGGLFNGRGRRRRRRGAPWIMPTGGGGSGGLGGGGGFSGGGGSFGGGGASGGW
ncbi:TPM domain-containing protein [Salinisphaera sp. Q1T1-3]|nr:TPM domain-containing protein [Salinisphaera sp. Q1T1-3]